MRKRLLSTMLALCVVLTMLPISALATETTEETLETNDQTTESSGTKETLEADDQVVESPQSDEVVGTPSATEGETKTPAPTAKISEPATLADDASTSGTCGENLTWKLENGTLTISGSGAMDDYTHSDMQPWHGDVLVNKNITNIDIKNGVTSIGNAAFSHCVNLTSITIPDSVTSIGNSAFSGSGLSTITIPDSVTSIGGSAFSATNLTNIIIPNSVTSIGAYVFSHCKGLTSVTIPDSITSISVGMFCECVSLSNLVIPNSITSIGKGAFQSCGLTTITIPDNVTSIGSGAFEGSRLTSITIPDGVTSISDRMFSDCDSLISVDIPNSVTSIGYQAFHNCYHLADIVIPDSVTSIGYAAFSVCRSLTSITIPDGITSLFSTFMVCERLTNITIPDSVTTLDGTFDRCSRLTSITIPDNVTSIGEDTFYWCGNLTSITIPDSVTSIGREAFDGCSSLADVYYKGSENSWNSIDIKYGNEYLTNAAIHYGGSNPDNSGDDKPDKPPITPPSTNPDITDLGTLAFKDVYYKDTIANADVHVDLSWNWNDLIKGDSDEYNKNLAQMGVALSAAIEGSAEDVGRILLYNLECDDVQYVENISPDMAIGIKEVKSKYGTEYIIFIVLRGTETTSGGDVLNDAFSSLNITHWGINPVYNVLKSCLSEWGNTYEDMNGNNTKFFVTGHSLGGACANLLAERLNREYGEEDVFGYTFAAPSPHDEMGDISRFHGNIYNFLCCQDAVPSHFHKRDSWYGYGYPRWFTMYEQFNVADEYQELTGKIWWDTYKENNYGVLDTGFLGVQLHAPSAYMAYLKTYSTLRTSMISYVCLRCPVDAEVYDSNNKLVGRIVNDEIDYSCNTPEISLIVCDGAKYVYFLNNDTYTIKIIGTGDGTMTYTAASKDMNTGIDEETKIYSNVKINTGKKFKSVVSSYDETDTNNLVEIPNVELLVTDDNGNTIAQVLPDTEASSLGKDNGTEIPIKNNNDSDDKPSSGTTDTKPGTNTEPDGNTPDTKPGTNIKPSSNASGTVPDNKLNNNPDNSEKSVSPKTGDGASIMLYVWLTATSGLFILLRFMSRKKGKDFT